MADEEIREDTGPEDVRPEDDGRRAREARSVLQDLDDVRARFAHRLATPWWYKVVSALLVAMLFVAAGMPYDGVPLGSSMTSAFLLLAVALAGPLLLRALLRRCTGASFDRYRNGWTAFSLATIGLLVLSLSLQAFAGADLAPLLGAVVGLFVTYRFEQQIDRRLARGELPGGRGALAA